MGICDSNKNNNGITNNTQTATIPQNTQIPTPQNTVSNLKQNLDSINETEKNEDNIDIGRPSNADRRYTLGSSINMDDSIGYNQTRNTYAN